MSNVYQPPESNLSNDTASAGDYGSIEKAISGDYEFSIGNVLSEAWAKIGGCKWQINLAFFFYFLIIIAAMVVMGTVMSVMTMEPESSAAMFMEFLIQIVVNLVGMPVMMGIVVMGMRRSVNAPVSATSVFSHFSKMIPLFATMVLMYIMIIIGLLLLVLPGIYLMVAYYMAMPLVVEKGMSPWQALETSRKAITHRWFSVFGLFIVLTIIMFISAIPLGLGMIWTIPMMIVAYGILYRNMFGIEAETIA